MSSLETQHYYRTDSNDSAASMLRKGDGEENSLEPEVKGPVRRECNPLWLAVGITLILALQVASTTGLFVYFSMSISKLQAETQGISEELRCLQIVNRMEDASDPMEFDPDGITLSESCQKLASSIKSYVTQVTENTMHRSAMRESRSYINSSVALSPRGHFITSSAHLTLQSSSLSGASPVDHDSERPSQSCRYTIRQWEHKNPLSHMHNMSYQNGHLRVPQDGKYYVYSQIYFRYVQSQNPSKSSTSGQQLVQCINKKTSYVTPVLLLKGVGTKCWASNAEYGLHSVHQGGVFDLRAGDELFVSVSSLDMVYTDGASSFFGVFRLDV
ncbi:tumor necrosis factor ligand superfamily member 10-like [Rhinophrynus dorsalis]